MGRVGTTATDSLADLDVTGGFITLQGNVTVDDQGGNTVSFNGQVSLTADVAIDTDGTTDNNVAFANRIVSSGTARDLTIVAGGGNATFSGIVGELPNSLDLFAVTSAGVVDVNAAANANNIAITATTTNLAAAVTALSDDVTITGNVVLDGNVTITTGGVAGDDFTVTGTVGADDSVANNRTLTVNAGAGTARFQSNIGPVANTSLADLDIVAGLIRLGGRVVADDVAAGVSTVTFGGPIQLEGANQVFDTATIGGGNNITFQGTINADDAVSQNRGLLVLSNTGTIQVQGAVGNLQPLSNFQLVALAGVVRLAANVTVTDGDTGAFAAFQGINIQLDADIVVTTDGAVVDHTAVFQGNVNADDAAAQDRKLTINAGAGVAGVLGNIGNTQPLADLDVIAGIFGAGGNITVNDGPAATLTFSGDLGITGISAVTINTNGTSDHGLTVGGRLGGDAAAQNTAVTIDAGTATVQLGAVGVGTFPSVAPDPPIIAAMADLDVTAGLIRLLGNVVIDDQGGNTATFNGPLELGADVSFDLDAASGADNSVLFSGAVASDATARDLTIAAGAGTVNFAAAVGAAPGHLDQFAVSSAALAEFDSTVRASDVALTAGTVRLQNNVTALSDDVTVTAAVVLDGNVGITTGGGAGG